MDAIDRQIIGELRENARISFSALGQSVGLSTNATAARVRKLEQTGVIVGYQVVLGEDAPDRPAGLEVFIDVRLEAGTDSEAFLGMVQSLPMVRDAVHVTGPYDYLLHVGVPDTGALDRLLRTLKREAGAGQTQTRLALRRT
ncbi:Lrp/AsnC family transcriptional regulator [Nakamurella silvestris]|nr:Lrp/AsnC family transcriptional regulator [Nakamurella silvestris]